MKVVSDALFGLGILWSLLQLVAAWGLLPPADLRAPRDVIAAPTSIEMARLNYFGCPLMRAFLEGFDADEPILAVGLLELAARCEGRSLFVDL